MTLRARKVSGAFEKRAPGPFENQLTLTQDQKLNEVLIFLL